MSKYEDIPIGSEYAISRAELSRKWKCSDRETRRIIADLRADDNGDDYIIVSHSSKAGYYRTNDVREIEHFRNEQGKRARKHFLPFRKINRVLREKRSANEAHI